MNELQNSLIESINILSSANKNIGTMTIAAEIKEIVDSGLGLYKVEYLGNTFNAYTNNISIKYAIGSNVYIIVPDGDFNKQKIIIGTTEPMALDTTSQEESANFIEVSDNLFNASLENLTIELCSYNTKEISIPIEDDAFNLIFEKYLDSYNNFLLFAKIKTDLPVRQQVGGKYGIVLNLPILITDEYGEIQESWKKYSLDINTIEGNPYRLSEWSPQDISFSIDTKQYKYDNTRQPILRAFVEDFTQDESIMTSDIFIKDISLKAINTLKEESNKGYFLSLKASGGDYFIGNSELDKTIEPILKLNGQNTSIEKYECYWFVEDASVKPGFSGYSTFGGFGWKCLNDKINISINDDGVETFQYATNKYQYKINASDVKTCLRYKCVVSCNGVLANDTIKFENLNSTIKLELNSKTGSSVFVKNVGVVSLVSTIKNYTINNDPRETIGYHWSRFDAKGKYIDDSFYQVDKLNSLEVNDLVTEISFPTNLIEDLNTIYCTIYSLKEQNGALMKTILGTNFLNISTESDALYTMSIQNDDILFKYDADGNSPLVSNYDGPIGSKVKNITPLSYKLYKASGIELTENEYNYVKTEWRISKNSMIQPHSSMTPSSEDENYFYFKNIRELPYNIANRYSNTKKDNNILLKVSFDGSTVSKNASIRFLKDGESGTNGSKYSAIVTYNGYGYEEKDGNGIPRKMQILYKPYQWFLYTNEPYLIEQIWYDYDYPGANPTPGISAFGLDIYEGGEKITSDTHSFEISFSMFDKLGTDRCFKVENSKLQPSFNAASFDVSKVYCNIVEAKIKVSNIGDSQSEEYIYAYYPIELTWYNRFDEYPYSVKPFSLDKGFSSVVYAADGTNPKYDNSESFICTNNNYEETTDPRYGYAWEVSENLVITKTENNTATIKPVTKFDNGISQNYIKVSFELTGEEIQLILNDINDLTLKEQYYNKCETYYRTNEHIFRLFLTQFKYNEWLNSLNGCKGLLAQRKYLLTELENVFKKLEDVNSFCANNSLIPSIFDYTSWYSFTYQELKKAEDKIRRLGDNIKLSELNTLINLKLSLSAYEVELKELVGPSIFAKLTVLVQDFNESINGYQLYFSLITAQQNGVFKFQQEYDIFKTLVQEFKEVPSYLNPITIDAHFVLDPDPIFVNMRSNLILLNRFKDFISYAEIKENILIPAFKLLDVYANAETEPGQIGCSLSEFGLAYFYNAISQVQDISIESRHKINKLQSLYDTVDCRIMHVKPIVMTYNRYGLSNINGWDGNKLYTGNSQEYILAPQVGAGIKENGLFTGMVMGIRSTNQTVNTETGLFGYSEGLQSMFLNARDGSALFGASGKGQIIISPKDDQALIKSGNYIAGTAETGSGMQIDLTTPEIVFGTGNFKVDQFGYLVAKGGGSIAGWLIGDTTLASKDHNLTLDSNFAKIYSKTHDSLMKTNEGFYLSYDGMSVGDSLRVSQNMIEVGRLSGTRKWTISGDSANSYISYNKQSLEDTSIEGVWLGTNGFRLGNKLKATNSGTVELGNLSGNHWLIDGSGESSIVFGQKGTANSVYLGTDAIVLGENRFKVDRLGNVSGGIGENIWSISSTGSAIFNNITANKTGSIGGWAISSNKLSAGNISLNAEGSIIADNWKILKDGIAYFQNVVLTNDGAANTVSSMNWKQAGSTVFSVSTQGNLYASLANISGTVKASAGNIGGVAINNGALVSSNGNFTINAAGTLTAKDAVFSGNIAASSLAFRNGLDGFLLMDSTSMTNNTDARKHPFVSGLNVGDGGIAFRMSENGKATHGIGGCYSIATNFITRADTLSSELGGAEEITIKDKVRFESGIKIEALPADIFFWNKDEVLISLDEYFLKKLYIKEVGKAGRYTVKTDPTTHESYIEVLPASPM